MDFHLYIAKKLRSGSVSLISERIAMVSIAISVAVVLAAISISEGFKHDICSRMAGFTGQLLLVVPGEQYTNENYPIDPRFSFSDKMAAIPGIASIDPVAYRTGVLDGGGVVQGILFKGVDSTYSASFFSNLVVEGRMPDFATAKPSDDILISKRIAAMLSLNEGEKVTAYFVGEKVRLRRFQICGIYDASLEGIDERLVLVDIRHIRNLNGFKPYECSCVEIQLDNMKTDSREQDAVMEEIHELIKTSPMDAEDSSVIIRSVSELFPSIFDWLALMDLNVLVVLVLMFAVAGFNMISGLLIILFERISTIGLFKALGMRSRSVCKVFLLHSGRIVLAGMAWGNAVMLPLLLVQKYLKPLTLNPSNYFVDHVPIHLTVGMWLLVNLLCIAVMALIMLIPTAFISKVSPDRTMRVN
ncbi:MAG: ABC transporter permease [Bacteroidales bacterium]|nr:ABC transporter permease [Bacteroidales bacterium]